MWDTISIIEDIFSKILDGWSSRDHKFILPFEFWHNREFPDRNFPEGLSTPGVCLTHQMSGHPEDQRESFHCAPPRI